MIVALCAAGGFVAGLAVMAWLVVLTAPRSSVTPAAHTDRILARFAEHEWRATDPAWVFGPRCPECRREMMRTLPGWACLTCRINVLEEEKS